MGVGISHLLTNHKTAINIGDMKLTRAAQISMPEKLARLVEAGITPMLWGVPGVGKTAMVLTDVARITGRPVIHVPLGGKPPEEVAGFLVDPGQEAKALQVKLTWWADLAFEASNAIVLLDELGSTSPTTQAAGLAVLQEKRMGKFRFPEGVRFIGAGNPLGTGADGSLMAPPMATRLMHFTCRADPEGWAEGALTRWGAGFDDADQAEGYRVVSAFIKSFPGRLVVYPGDQVYEAEDPRIGWPNYRSWEMVAKSIGALGGIDEEAIVGALGVGEASAFVEWALAQDMPDIRDVLSQASSFNFPKSQDKFLAILDGVLALTSADQKLWDQAWELYDRAMQARPDLAYPAAIRLAKFGAGQRWPMPRNHMGIVAQIQKEVGL